MSTKSKKLNDNLSAVEHASTSGKPRVKHTPTSPGNLNAILEPAKSILEIVKKVEHPEDKKFFELHINAIVRKATERLTGDARKAEIERIRKMTPEEFEKFKNSNKPE